MITSQKKHQNEIKINSPVEIDLFLVIGEVYPVGHLQRVFHYKLLNMAKGEFLRVLVMRSNINDSQSLFLRTVIIQPWCVLDTVYDLQVNCPRYPDPGSLGVYWGMDLIFKSVPLKCKIFYYSKNYTIIIEFRPGL